MSFSSAARALPASETRTSRSETVARRNVPDAKPAFVEIYAEWFRTVVRWARAFGALDSEFEDIAQEVFIVVRRKHAEFDGANVAGWLYRITSRVVARQRRRRWFKNLLLRRDVSLDELASATQTPIQQLDQRDRERVLLHILGKMSPKRRTAFVLFEVEGYSGEEIAALEQIPIATVWTRLHHARKDYLKLVGAYRREEGRE